MQSTHMYVSKNDRIHKNIEQTFLDTRKYCVLHKTNLKTLGLHFQFVVHICVIILNTSHLTIEKKSGTGWMHDLFVISIAVYQTHTVCMYVVV